MTTISILPVDDHPVVREGCRRLLERRPGFHVTAEAEDAPRAYQTCKAVKPDVIVMDLTLEGAWS